jgi:tetratricopeptide (TPR) repeat protein
MWLKWLKEIKRGPACLVPRFDFAALQADQPLRESPSGLILRNAGFPRNLISIVSSIRRKASKLTVIAGLCLGLGLPGRTLAEGGAGPATAAYHAGLAAMQTGAVEEALDDFERAVRLDPNLADAQNALGQLLLQRGDVEGAVRHFAEVTRLKPALAVGHAYLAQALTA